MTRRFLLGQSSLNLVSSFNEKYFIKVREKTEILREKKLGVTSYKNYIKKSNKKYFYVDDLSELKALMVSELKRRKPSKKSQTRNKKRNPPKSSANIITQIDSQEEILVFFKFITSNKNSILEINSQTAI